MPARTTTIARSDTRRRLIIAATTFLLISFLVIRTSEAAFTATHVNPDNEFAAATIDLDGATEPMFGQDGLAQTDAMDLYPGNAVEACIDIAYDGEVFDLTPVNLSISGATAGSLADDLTVSIDRLDDDCASGDPDETLVDGDALSSVTGTATSWTPSADGEVRGFRFSVEVADDDSLQGESLSGVDVTWSVETTTS